MRHWAGFRWEDCKQQAGVLVGEGEKDFSRVALVVQVVPVPKRSQRPKALTQI